MPERIKLVTGHCAPLTRLGYVVVMLAVAGIVSSTSSWSWKAGALVLLGAASWFVFRCNPAFMSRAAGTLDLDGTAVESRGREEVLLECTGRAWVSSLFSVIHFRECDSGRKCSWLVCAANNHPDDYRRMLGFLRLDNSAAQGSEP